MLKANEKRISMSKGPRCLRCDRPCDANVEFCDECRDILRASFRQESVVDAPRSEDPSPSQQTSSSTALKVVNKSPITPHPPVLETLPDSALQAMARLNEAAQRMAEGEQGRHKRLPHASRLAPFRDISSEIRRESTPLPKFTTPHNQHDLRDSEAMETLVMDQNGREHIPSSEEGTLAPEAEWPDLWPWFDNDDEGREGEDTWAGRTDPLITRHKPNSIEAALIEEEDIQRALSEGIPTNHLPIRIIPRKSRKLRIAFFALAIFAVLALAIDGILLSVVFVHPHSQSGASSGLSAPSLKLATNFVNVSTQAQPVQLQILNFTRNSSVQLTHDIQEPVQMSSGASLVSIGESGTANVTIEVTPDWGPGFHLIVAEDIVTRYTASATLQVFGKAKTKPAHLEIGVAAQLLDFGANFEGVNSTKSLKLSNSGSGSITWSASSHQSWLVLSPNQGMFNQSQTIQVAVQRNLAPKDYAGTITFFSNVGPPQKIAVSMTVENLPLNPGPVLSLSPAALSFTAVDGGSPPPSQTLTINNPGSQPLNWSLATSASSTASTMVAIAHALGGTGNWLSADNLSGNVPAQSSQQINISVSSSDLLPGAYTGTLTFSAPGALDNQQKVSVSLTVQPHCGLVTTTGFLPFTVVQGKVNSSSQAVGLSATESCNSQPVNWVSQVSTPSWLTVSPGSGQLKGINSQFLSVSVNATGLAPSTYYGYIVFTAQNSTQTVFVQLQVQAAPSPTASAPVMTASPLNLNFSYTQGQPNPKGQVVTITNNGSGTLRWSTTPQQYASPWLGVSPSGGVVQPGQSGTVTINVDGSKQSPGTYSGQVTLNGFDSSNKPASGSGQVVSVNLVVQPPCTLTQPSSSSLAFTGVQGGPNPISQTVLISGTGNCTWPLVLNPTVSTTATWLKASANSSNINGNGQSASFTIGPGARYSTLPAGNYTGQVTIAATDSAGTLALGSPQTISVTLTVLPPCMLAAPSLTSLSFTTIAGASSTAAQSVGLHETGTCSRPVTYSVTGTSWLTLSQPAPDTGSGSSLSVNVNATGLAAGTQTGSITITATDSNGGAVLNTQTITVTVTITPATGTISGIVYACSGTAPVCSTPTPLPGATITVLSSLGATITTVTADVNGAYSIPSLPVGVYTINITGAIGSTTYSGTGLALNVTGDATGVNFQIFPG